MDYTRVVFSGLSPEQKEILIARCAIPAICGMEETEDTLVVYFPDDADADKEIRSVASATGAVAVFSRLPDQNWNREWEQNFQPVYIDDFCCIRADFHPAPEKVTYDIIITPKMSFGTGHHATTELMIRALQQTDVNGQAVLDFGTGTGILAILALKLGAASVVAIDNDDRAVENAAENLQRNNADGIRLTKASLGDLPGDHCFDILLANINRNVILNERHHFERLLKAGGLLLLSGLLTEDQAAIRAALQAQSFVFVRQQERDGWQLLVFRRAVGRRL